MKTWDDLSDFDLSFNVAKLSMPSNNNIQEFFGKVCTGAVSGHNADSYQFVYFDINNPADMWPIILQNDISLINDKGFCYATSNCYETFEPHGLGVADGYFYSKAKDKSELLRAAAIVFLMMNGVNQE